MLVTKLLDGVVVVERGSSRRAFRPKFVQRLLLAWLFRHFATLPMAVLSGWQKAMVAKIISKGRTVPVPNADLGLILGIIETVVPQPRDGKPAESSTGWEFATRNATSNRISA